MRLKYITKPVLIDFLRYMDKNNYLHGPYRIRYSSFRSKRDMLADFEKMFVMTEDTTNYTFTLRGDHLFLNSPVEICFDKKTFQFHVEGKYIDLASRPLPVRFHIRRGKVALIF